MGFGADAFVAGGSWAGTPTDFYSNPARALDVGYQNTTAKVRWVSVGVALPIVKAAGGSTNSTHVIIAKIGPTSAVTLRAGIAGISVIVTLTGYYLFAIFSPLTFAVPPDYYYKIVTAKSGDTGTPIINAWMEWDG